MIIKIVLIIILAIVFIIVGFLVPAKEFKIDKNKYDMSDSEFGYIVKGRMDLSINSIKLKGRFITYYIEEVGFYRYLEVTWYKIPILHGYDLLLPDEAIFCIANKKEEGEKIKQGQVIAMESEKIWYNPKGLVVDEDGRVQISMHGIKEEIILSALENGKINEINANRYKGNGVKIGWKATILDVELIDGNMIPSKVALKWEDEKKAWATFYVDAVYRNVPISKNFNLERK